MSQTTSAASAALDALIHALETPDALVFCEPWRDDEDMTLVHLVLHAQGFDLALDVECVALGEDEPVHVGQPHLHPTSRATLEAAGLLPGGDRDPRAVIAARGRLELAVATAHRGAIAAAAPRLIQT